MTDLGSIEDAEARLRAAMLAGDVAALDALLGDALVFTDHTGARLSKAEDLAAHRSGRLRLARLEPSGQTLIRRLGDTAIVCVTLDLAGRFDAQPFAGTFAYTRVWHRGEDGRWRVEAAHCSAVGDR